MIKQVNTLEIVDEDNETVCRVHLSELNEDFITISAGESAELDIKHVDDLIEALLHFKRVHNAKK